MNWESVNRVELGGAVTLSGLVIVFVALLILIMAVVLMGKLLGVKPKAKPQPPIESAPPAASAPAAPTAAPPAMAVQGGIEEDTVAAISAAVAYMMQESAPGVAYAVTDIRRNSFVRPVWGFAGMQQNTRPF